MEKPLGQAETGKAEPGMGAIGPWCARTVPEGSPAPSLTPAPSLWDRALLHLGDSSPGGPSPTAESPSAPPLKLSTLKYPYTPLGHTTAPLNPDCKHPASGVKHALQPL